MSDRLPGGQRSCPWNGVFWKGYRTWSFEWFWKGETTARVKNTGFEEHLPWDFAEIDAQQIIPHDLTTFHTIRHNSWTNVWETRIPRASNLQTHQDAAKNQVRKLPSQKHKTKSLRFSHTFPYGHSYRNHLMRMYMGMNLERKGWAAYFPWNNWACREHRVRRTPALGLHCKAK